jgi:alpha-galactosidase
VVKVFILAGQSNMVGKGTVSIEEALRMRDNRGLSTEAYSGQGTLEYLVNNSPRKSRYAHLVDSRGRWAERDDVWLVDLDGAGPLTITGKTFGPELQFGHVMGNYFDEQVVIIKIAWGGKSLHVDFRPPSSGQEGPSYRAMINRIRQVRNNLEDYLPGYRGQRVEIAGFGWHQGWNDRIDQEYNAAYRKNCVNFINDVRWALRAPDLPFVLATTGMRGWGETQQRGVSLMEAQLAVPHDSGLRRGRVFAVETRSFWRDEALSPVSEGFHWNRNAETYFLIGNALAQQMIKLVSPSAHRN